MKLEDMRYYNDKAWTSGILILLLVGLLFVACSDDSVEEQRRKQKTVTVMTGMPTFFEVNKTPTRALPYGYVVFTSLYPSTPPAHATIGIILAKSNSATDYDRSNYSVVLERDAQGNATSHWKAVIDVEDGVNYSIYGFMPKEDAGRATITALDGKTFKDGCILSINNLNTLSSGDVCAIVGVGTNNEAANITDLNVLLGKFDYNSEPYLYLLLKHLYAGLHFKTHIDTEYAKLRVIKVKNMTLKTSTKISHKINLGVTIVANTTGADPVPDANISYADAFTNEDDYDYATIQLFPQAGNTATEFEVPTQTTEEFLSCFAPGKCNSFILTSRYDVYDKKGNLIRENCTAVNKIDATDILEISALRAGDIYTIDLKIEPTYLYVLADPDLDNPTFTVVTDN